MSLEFEDQLQVIRFHSIIQKTIVTNFLKSGRQYMHEKSSDEFYVGHSNGTSRFTFFKSSSTKYHMSIGYGDNSAVRDSNLMCVTAKIFNSITKTIKGLFDIRTLVFLIKRIFKFLPF